MSFASLNLNSNIYKALTACGYSEPTPIQAQSIPSIMNGKDVVASAQTGTGKTAAFVLPALHKLSEAENPSKNPRILILTPTRELASQITKAASVYGKFLRFNIVSLVGGMPYHHQIKDLARGADIIVATPGRLMDHMEQNRVNLSNIQMLVLDEADRMLDMGFIADVEHIAKLTPSDRQTLLFSATVDKQLANIVKHLLKNPVRIDLSNEKISAPNIKQELYKANNPPHKIRLLKHFLNDANIFKAIIFSATKINADKLANQLIDDGFSAAALHGDLRQNVRTRTLEQLRRGKIQYLVATDVAARGIDVSDITHVFNYDMPRSCEDYVHRIGRTARAGKSGKAISFVLPGEVRHIQRIERFIGQRLQFCKAEGVAEFGGEKESYSRSRDESHPRSEREYSHRSRSEEGGHRQPRAERAFGHRSKGENEDSRPARTSRDFSHRPKRDNEDSRPARTGRDFSHRSKSENEDSRPSRTGRDFSHRPKRDNEDSRPARTGRDFSHRPKRDNEDSRPSRTGGDFSHRPKRDNEDSRPSRTGGDFSHRPKRENDDYRPARTGRDFSHRPKSESEDARPARTGRAFSHRSKIDDDTVRYTSAGRGDSPRNRMDKENSQEPRREVEVRHRPKKAFSSDQKKPWSKDNKRPFKKRSDKKTYKSVNDRDPKASGSR